MINSQLIKDFSEYSGISVDEIIQRISMSVMLNKMSFESSSDPRDFYENSDTYIYDLFNANYDEDRLVQKIDLFSPGFMFDLASRKDGKFLEFGGGLGVFCEIVKKRTNLEVTYCDIKTKISDFTSWRYDKYGIPIKRLIIPQEDFQLDGKYDVIFTDAVIEHLEAEQQEIYVKKLGSYVNLFGVLCLLIDLEGENPEMPMHNNVDITKLHRILEDDGLMCVYGKNTFSSRWVKTK
jgi:hypothetical protein